MYMGSNGAGCIHLQKNGFLRRETQQLFGKKCKRAKAMYACVEKFRIITNYP